MVNMEYKIIFGDNEKESKNNTYNNMSVTLNIGANENGARAGILFSIEEGYPEGQFDMSRLHTSKGLTIEEAKQLVHTLQRFISQGEQFLEEYKEQ